MKAVDPFADDLDNFDAIVTALKTTRSRRDEPVARTATSLASSSTPTSSFATMTTTTAAAATTTMTSPMMTNAAHVMRGRRAATVQVPQFTLASPTAAPSSAASVATTGRANATATPAAPRANGGENNNDEDDPLAFLEANAHQPSTTAAATAVPSAFVHPNTHETPARNDSAAADSMLGERHELLATLDALDAELTGLDGKLETAQIKEEAELLKLDTDLIEKRMTIAAEEAQAATRRAALQEQTAQRLAALEQRAAQERQAQDDEVAALEEDRYARRSKELMSTLATVTASVAGLQQQCALIVSQQPFSPHGLRLAVSNATTATAIDTSDAAAADDAETTAETPAPPPPSPPQTASTVVARGMERALELLRGYCDDRVRRMRDRVVDHLHAATTDAAEGVRATHLTAWAQDAAARKGRLAEYAEQALARYRDFVQARAELKERNLTTLRAQLRQTTDELRERAKTRLDALLHEVSEKLEQSLRGFDESAAATRRSLEQRAAATRDADTAMAQAQLHEVTTRYGAEAAVQQRLYGTQRASLQEQLAKLQAQGDRDTHSRFAALQAEASAATRRANERVKVRLAELQDAVERAVRESTAVATTTMAAARPDTVAQVQELEYTSQALLRQLAAQQEEQARSRARAQALRDSLCVRFKDELLAKLHESRAAQQAQQATADFVRLSWERECRQQLIGGGSSSTRELASLLPLSPPQAAPAPSSPPRREIVTEELCTTTPVWEVAAADMLEHLVQQMRRRDIARDALRTRRTEGAAATRARLEALRTRCAQLYALWSQLLHKLEACDEAQAKLAQQQIAVAKETVRVELARQEMAREHAGLARRCVQLERQGASCAKERAAVMGAHARLQEVLRESIGLHAPNRQDSSSQAVLGAVPRDIAPSAAVGTTRETDGPSTGDAPSPHATPTCAVMTTPVHGKSANASAAPSSSARHSADRSVAGQAVGLENSAASTTPPPREHASQSPHHTLTASPLSSSSVYRSSPFIDMVPLAASTNTSVCTM